MVSMPINHYEEDPIRPRPTPESVLAHMREEHAPIATTDPEKALRTHDADHGDYQGHTHEND